MASFSWIYLDLPWFSLECAPTRPASGCPLSLAPSPCLGRAPSRRISCCDSWRERISSKTILSCILI